MRALLMVVPALLAAQGSAKLDREKQLLSRDVIVVDMRLPDRIALRLPEGRSLDDVTSWADTGKGKSRS